MNKSEAKPTRRGCLYFVRLVGFALAILAPSLYIGFGLIAANGYTHPQRLPNCCETPDDYGLSYESISFTTADNVEIKGWHIASRNHATIVLVHGLASNRVMTLPVAAMLADHGYGALMIDMRHHGNSGDAAYWANTAARDVVAAVDFLKSRPNGADERVGVWGFSAGGTTVIHAAADSPEIEAIVADGPGWSNFNDEPLPPYSLSELMYLPFDWVFFNAIPAFHTPGTPARSAATDIATLSPRPLLLIVAAEEGITERRVGDRFYAAAQNPKELWLVESGHFGKWEDIPSEYEQRITLFFDGAFQEQP